MLFVGIGATHTPGSERPISPLSGRREVPPEAGRCSYININQQRELELIKRRSKAESQKSKVESRKQKAESRKRNRRIYPYKLEPFRAAARGTAMMLTCR